MQELIVFFSPAPKSLLSHLPPEVPGVQFPASWCPWWHIITEPFCSFEMATALCQGGARSLTHQTLTEPLWYMKAVQELKMTGRIGPSPALRGPQPRLDASLHGWPRTPTHPTAPTHCRAVYHWNLFFKKAWVLCMHTYTYTHIHKCLN